MRGRPAGKATHKIRVILPKKYTILVIPEGTHRVKRFSLHALVFPFIFLLLASALGLVGYMYVEYRTMAAAMPNYQAVRQQAQHQSFQLGELSVQLEDFKEQLDQVRSFNDKLRELSRLDTKLAGAMQEVEAPGLGGPEGNRSGAGIKIVSSAHERQIMAMSRELDQLRTESENELRMQQELVKFLQQRRSILQATPSIWPTRGLVTSGYGQRNSPWSGKMAHHRGLDIAAPIGTPVKAPADGVVTFSDYDGAYGRTIVITHGYGMTTRYAHLSASSVTVGQQVKRGELIGKVGNTGRSTGPHLHYEVHLSGVPTNPRNYLGD